MTTKLPEYVEYAFTATRVISTEEWLREDINAFTQRWGGVDLSTFAHVLQHAQEDDQMVAAFALGHTRSRWARDLLLPFLQSDHPGVRWAAALSLGEMHEEQAQPVLIQMLQEFLPPPYPPQGEVGPDWFEVEHMHVASILGRWGDAALAPALQVTLARVWQVERDFPEHANRAGLELRRDYQDALTYALGQLGAFDALSDMDIPLPQRRLWTVNIALGFLNAQAYCKQTSIGIIQDMALSHRYQDLYPLLLQVLQQKSGLTFQEATEYVQCYCEDYFNRREKRDG